MSGRDEQNDTKQVKGVFNTVTEAAMSLLRYYEEITRDEFSVRKK